METNESTPDQSPVTPDIQSAPTSVETITPPQAASAKKTPWLIIVLILALVAVAGYFGFQNYQLKQQLTNGKSTTSPAAYVGSSTPMASPTEIVDNISGWERYTADDLGITFQHPPTVQTVKRGEVSQLGPAITLVTKSEYSQVQETTVDATPIAIYIGNKNSPRQDYYFGGYKWTENIVNSLELLGLNQTQQGAKENITKQKNMTVGGIQTYKYSAIPNIEGSQYLGVALIKEDNSYLFMFNSADTDLTESDFDNILSSFQFTN